MSNQNADLYHILRKGVIDLVKLNTIIKNISKSEQECGISHGDI